MATATQANVTKVGRMVHRTGTRKMKAHEYVLKNLSAERQKVIAHIEKRFDVTPATATSWYQAFKRDALTGRKARGNGRKTPASRSRKSPARKGKTTH